jgi:hypothetical protein
LLFPSFIKVYIFISYYILVGGGSGAVVLGVAERAREREHAIKRERESLVKRRKVHWPSFASSVAVSKEHEVMNLPPANVYTCDG